MHPDHEHEQTGAPIGRRVTVKETALILGTTIEGVRARIKRGTLREEKAPDGTVYIILNGDQTSPDGVQTPPNDRPYLEQTPEDTALVEETLPEQIERLQAEPDAWKSVVTTRERDLKAKAEELRRRDYLLAAAIERIPALEAPESPEKPADSSEKGTELQKQIISRGDTSGSRRRQCPRSCLGSRRSGLSSPLT